MTEVQSKGSSSCLTKHQKLVITKRYEWRYQLLD